MRLQNDVEIEIHKTWYNKTMVQPDGITHIVDTSTRYTAYQFGLAKNYYDIDSKEEVIDEIIEDLQTTIEELKLLKQKSKEERTSNEDIIDRT